MADNSFKIKNSLVLTPVDLATLTNPQAGDLACDSNDSNKIKRYDALTSAWTEVGSGGVGSVDIMFVQDFESASLATFVSPTDVTLSTTDPLHGKVSALLTHDASVNKSFKQIIPVDRKFRGQAMVLDLNVKSAASAGNVTIKITDESAPADLIASEQLQLSNDVSGRRSSVSFTIPSTCASLSYTITALPEAGSPVTRIDDIVAMLSDVSLLETSVLVPNMTAWQGYTPTFQGFGSPTNIEFEWRQIGENVEIRGKFTLGATTGVEARVGLPAGLTSAGTGIIPSLQICGHAAFNVNSTTYFSTEALIEPSVSYLTFGQQTSTTAGLTKANGNMGSLGNILSFFASVPCAGLSATTTKTIPLTQSGLVQNADSYLRINGFTPVVGSTANKIITLISNTYNQNIGDAIQYLDDAVNGARFIAQKEGLYRFEFSADAHGSAGWGIGFSKNAASLTANLSALPASERIANGYDTGANNIAHVFGEVYLAIGDIVRIHADGVTSAANSVWSTFTASYAGSLKQVSVSSDQKITIPTSELRFEGASTRGSTATAIVKFDTMAKLRGDAFTVTNTAADGTYITMLKAGKLAISTSVSLTSVNTFAYITKNQQILTAAPSTSEALASSQAYAATALVNVSTNTDVKVGDIIRVAANGGITSATLNNLNLSFQEQDISVSVTNTLPQFSESDSSVRVTTANGYGTPTGTKIRRFSNTVDNIGSDVVYADSATNGATFTIQTNGIYSISYIDTFNAIGWMGISKNASSLSTNIFSLTAVEKLATSTTTAADYAESVSWTGYLNAGDIIRAHTDGNATGTDTSRTQFTISKVGKPNVTGVDVTPFVNVPQPESQSSTIQQVASFGVATITGSLTGSKGTGIYSYDSSTGIYTVLKNCSVVLSFGADPSAGSTVQPGIQIDGSTFSRSNSPAVAGQTASTSYSGTLTVGQNFRFVNGANTTSAQRISVLATALSDQILTAPETFSTDTAALSYASSAAYTLSTLQNAPVGTYITFTYAANTNTRTQTTTRPTQTDADMNVNGMLIYTRAYNAASTAAQPAAFAIQIGKGLKGKTIDLYKSAGKVNAGVIDLLNIANTQQRGLGYKEYNEVTGILLIDAGVNFSSANTDYNLQFHDLTSQTSGYLVINASKNPALTGLSLGSSVKAKYTSNSGQAVGTSATLLTMEDSVYDSNNAYTSGVYTVPENGTYIIAANWVTAAVAISASTGSMNISIYVDGVLASNSFIRGTGNTLAHLASITDQFVLRKGQTISIYGACSTATTMANGSFSITKFSAVKDI